MRIMITDDHPVVREGFAAMIGTEPDMTVVAQARSGEEAIELFRRLRPDVTLMDLRRPGMGGVDAIRAIRREFPASRLIVLTTYDGDEDIYRALEAGAQAYLLKDMICDEILAAIRRVLARGYAAVVPHERGSRRPIASCRFARSHSASSSCRCNTDHSATRPIARGGSVPDKIVRLSIAIRASCSAYSAWKCGGTWSAKYILMTMP
jgi:DNA-binding NarL/FixJ family response regulator